MILSDGGDKESIEKLRAEISKPNLVPGDRGTRAIGRKRTRRQITAAPVAASTGSDFFAAAAEIPDE